MKINKDKAWLIFYVTTAFVLGMLIMACQVEKLDELDELDIENDLPGLVKSMTVNYVEAYDEIEGKQRTIEFSYSNSKIVGMSVPYFASISSQFLENVREWTFEYDDQNRLIGITKKIENIIGLKYEFEYENERLIKYTSTRYPGWKGYISSGSSSSFENTPYTPLIYIFEWSADNKSITKYQRNGELIASEEVYDTENNLTYRDGYGGVNQIYGIRFNEYYEYDSNINPFYNQDRAVPLPIFDILPIYFGGIGKNNLTQTRWDDNFITDYTYSDNLEYTYDSNGYPLTLEWTYSRRFIQGKYTYTYNY